MKEKKTMINNNTKTIKKRKKKLIVEPDELLKKRGKCLFNLGFFTIYELYNKIIGHIYMYSSSEFKIDNKTAEAVMKDIVSYVYCESVNQIWPYNQDEPNLQRIEAQTILNEATFYFKRLKLKIQGRRYTFELSNDPVVDLEEEQDKYLDCLRFNNGLLADCLSDNIVEIMKFLPSYNTVISDIILEIISNVYLKISIILELPEIKIDKLIANTSLLKKKILNF